MSEHVVDVSWSRGEHEFTYQTYSRDHDWRFDGGVTVPASANPKYLGTPAPVDPEEAFVAALSSCHMLTFLSIAAKKRIVVDTYDDHAVGVMTPNERGKLAITKVTLHPKITFAGPEPDREVLAKIHHLAHEECFIANSVTTEIEVDF
ncbi:organic hydroperoxide reductase OsmC/OhrA [Kribbella amoyensis]|uniref:Organic hydroperoxide reductase OsmC/OhrA n=1 Tax=Kribbella amoyensis TaxID=996641 RepID=A0A561BRE1_9ACTN|nr:OsmC family protein [Kribbella amoyensis]TWD81468.1 organic hydroperoxide reductase OsmC/OhrA [Kribbella amoyensis]